MILILLFGKYFLLNVASEYIAILSKKHYSLQHWKNLHNNLISNFSFTGYSGMETSSQF